MRLPVFAHTTQPQPTGGWGQATNTTYSVTNLGIAWMAFFAGDGTISAQPYKNENA